MPLNEYQRPFGISGCCRLVAICLVLLTCGLANAIAADVADSFNQFSALGDSPPRAVEIPVRDPVSPVSANVDPDAAGSPAPIVIDGQFDDWNDISAYEDPSEDTNDTEPRRVDAPPVMREHLDADLLKYAIAHDTDALYFYMKSRGQIGRTQVEDRDKKMSAGRYYVIVTIDVDQNDETGYWLHEGGYFPTSRGYDVNAELEFYNGSIHVAKYLNHGAENRKEVWNAYQDQSRNQHSWRNLGPHPPGHVRLGPGHYDFYTEWVYDPDDTIRFVRDKGRKLGLGIVTYAQSKDAHEIEMRFPYKGFLKDAQDRPLIGLGSVLDISMSLEASGEFASSGRWASDTGAPILQYTLSPAGIPDEASPPVE